MDQDIALGSKARDIVSGWEGIVTARYEYLNGCVRYEIGGKDKDGKPDQYVFDAQQIRVIAEPDVELVPRPVVVPPPARSERIGGPRDNRPVTR